MSMFKKIVFCVMLVSVFGQNNIASIIANSQVDNTTEAPKTSEKNVQQIYYEYYKDIQKNNNYFHLVNPKAHTGGFQYVYNPAPMLAHASPVIYIPEGSSKSLSYVPYSNKHKNNLKLLKKYLNLDETNLRHKKNTDELNLNSLEFIGNMKREPHRQRVKNIREHFKKYMQHFMNRKDTVASKTKHNFEPYQPMKDMLMFKVQDSEGFLNKHNSNNDNKEIKYLHIIEGNELLRNIDDTDYRFHIAYTDS